VRPTEGWRDWGFDGSSHQMTEEDLDPVTKVIRNRCKRGVCRTFCLAGAYPKKTLTKKIDWIY